jgi:hypothetical protein
MPPQGSEPFRRLIALRQRAGIEFRRAKKRKEARRTFIEASGREWRETAWRPRNDVEQPGVACGVEYKSQDGWAHSSLAKGLDEVPTAAGDGTQSRARDGDRSAELNRVARGGLTIGCYGRPCRAMRCHARTASVQQYNGADGRQTLDRVAGIAVREQPRLSSMRWPRGSGEQSADARKGRCKLCF